MSSMDEKIVIYKTKNGPQMDVRLEQETVWLTQKQMSQLFGKDVRTINEHIGNVFRDGELKKNSVIRNFRITAADKKTYVVNIYNLDVIISVGYRVKSFRGTQFRIWATKTLRQHLVKGYTINEKRLLQAKNNLNDLQSAISFLREKAKHTLLTGQEQQILSLLADYSKTLTLLEQYDKEKLSLSHKGKGTFLLQYETAYSVIGELKKVLFAKKEASSIFGQEYEDKFKAILGNILQTFGENELYPSLEEKAAHLLYFVIKDHSFVDGNKRIGSFLFIYFLDRNNYLYKQNKEKKINDNALTALSLLIAISNPKEKDTMIKIITNLLKE